MNSNFHRQLQHDLDELHQQNQWLLGRLDTWLTDWLWLVPVAVVLVILLIVLLSIALPIIRAGVG